jgi:amino acid transporter
MLLCVVIYMAVAAAAIGAVTYTRFANSPEPLALILRQLGQPGAAAYLAASAVIALPTVILAFFYGQSRIFFVMARDGLLPRGLATVSRRGSPVKITLFTAVIVAILAGLIPLDELAALANAGTLTAFIAVAVCMLIMRRRAPDAPRRFRTPLAWPVGLVAILGCLYLIYSLPQTTQLYFLIAQRGGLAFYLLYGSRRSVAQSAASVRGPPASTSCCSPSDAVCGKRSRAAANGQGHGYLAEAARSCGRSQMQPGPAGEILVWRAKDEEKYRLPIPRSRASMRRAPADSVSRNATG